MFFLLLLLFESKNQKRLIIIRKMFNISWSNRQLGNVKMKKYLNSYLTVCN